MKKKKTENLPATYRKELLNKFVKIDFIFFGSFMLRLVELFLLNSYCPEAATRGVLCKKLFLEISQNSLVFSNFIKKEPLTQVFSCEFCEISKNTFFTEHLWTTASNCRLTEFIEFIYWTIYFGCLCHNQNKLLWNFKPILD